MNSFNRHCRLGSAYGEIGIVKGFASIYSLPLLLQPCNCKFGLIEIQGFSKSESVLLSVFGKS